MGSARYVTCVITACFQVVMLHIEFGKECVRVVLAATRKGECIRQWLGPLGRQLVLEKGLPCHPSQVRMRSILDVIKNTMLCTLLTGRLSQRNTSDQVHHGRNYQFAMALLLISSDAVLAGRPRLPYSGLWCDGGRLLGVGRDTTDRYCGFPV